MAGFSAGPRYNPNVYGNYRPYPPTTQPSSTSGSSLSSDPKFSCLVGDSYGARPTYGTGPPRSESISSLADLQYGFGRSASYGTYTRGGSLTIGAPRTGGQGSEPPVAGATEGGSSRQKKGKAPVEKRSYVCNECGNSYASRDTLQTHMKSHTEETYCVICKYKLSTVANYKRHMEQQHQAEFPKQDVQKEFVCPYDQCSKAFAKQYYLNDHMKVHTGGTFCPYCFESFSTTSNLRRHIRKMHPNEVNV